MRPSSSECLRSGPGLTAFDVHPGDLEVILAAGGRDNIERFAFDSLPELQALLLHDGQEIIVATTEIDDRVVRIDKDL